MVRKSLDDFPDHGTHAALLVDLDLDLDTPGIDDPRLIEIANHFRAIMEV